MYNVNAKKIQDSKVIMMIIIIFISCLQCDQHINIIYLYIEEDVQHHHFARTNSHSYT